MRLTDYERELIAKALVYTRVGAFSDPARAQLHDLVRRLDPEGWGRTAGCHSLLPVKLKQPGTTTRAGAHARRIS